MQAPVVNPQTGTGPAPHFSQLRCHDCGNPVGNTAGFGFCRMCGAPMCFFCASNSVIFHETNRRMIIPLIFITLIRTKSVRSKVTVCRTCLSDLYYRKSRVLPESMMGSLMVALCIALPIIGGYGLEAAAGATIMAVLFGILSFIPIFVTLRYLDEKRSRPTCPVCGKDAMGMLFKTSSALGVGSGTFPDFIDCGCGYQGPRAPLDGLWVFVQKNGWAPLSGGPLEKMAQASAFAARNRR
jgi:hypothetical protein